MISPRLGFSRRVKFIGKTKYAEVAELADALDSGSSECKFMWVQVPSPAPNKSEMRCVSDFLYNDGT